MQRLEFNAAIGLLALLLAVPTVTPNRRIVVTTRPVVVDMIVITDQRGSGPAKTTITPAAPSATRRNP